MLVTGFLGSPRKSGNTAFLLKTFLKEAEHHGAQTRLVHVPDLSIHPCTGCGLCEKKGFCHFDDDMTREIYPLMRMSDVVVIASPIYFYTVPAELKALIDRSQTLWARKYKLRLSDSSQNSRKGFLLSVGATRGGDLFDSIRLTMKYFFQGIAAEYTGDLTYSRIEEPGEIKRHPTVKEDIREAVTGLLAPLEQRKPTVVFVCRDNCLASPMAEAFARHLAADRIHILSAGIQPGDHLHPQLIPAMARKGLDLAYRSPQSIASVLSRIQPDYVIVLGDGNDTAVHIPGARIRTWDAPGPSVRLSPDRVARLRDRIELQVQQLIDELTESA